MTRLFILERYVAGLSEASERADAAAMAAAAAEVRVDGDDVRWLGCVGLPGEDTEGALFAAESARVVGRVAERAGLAYERIVEAIAVRPATLARRDRTRGRDLRVDGASGASSR